jgi:hypothetical protein
MLNLSPESWCLLSILWLLFVGVIIPLGIRAVMAPRKGGSK